MSTISPRTTFLVSGGARGVTASCVVGLARRYGSRFILLGRTSLDGDLPAWAEDGASESELKARATAALEEAGEKPTPLAIRRLTDAIISRREVEATLQSVRDAGGKVAYVCADVTDGDTLAERLREPIEQFGPVNVLVHGAGALADKRIEQKTAADFDRVFSPKVVGLRNLLACVPPSQLDALILFSSAAGFFGNAGQTDYAIANEILNKIAHRIARTQPTCRVLVFDWGPWDGGMVTPALKQAFAERNIEVIPVESGVQTVVDALSVTPSAVQVLVGSQIPRPAQPTTGPLRTYRLRRRLTAEANPFVRDHVIGGRPVLPMVSSMSWLTTTAEQLFPGYVACATPGHRVLKGIIFDESLADPFVLRLEERRKDADFIEVYGRIHSTAPNGRERYHYEGTVELRPALPAAPVLEHVDLSERDPIDGPELYRNGICFHGPLLQGIDRVLNSSPTGLTLRCVMPQWTERDQGQFPIQTTNQYTLDVQSQGMLVWARLFRGMSGVPLRVERGESFRPIVPGDPFYATLTIRSQSATSAVGDVVAHDQHGLVFSRLLGVEITLSERLNAMFAHSVEAS